MVGFQGESPADRRALEGAASRSFRDVQAMFKRVRAPEEKRVSRFKQTNLALPTGGLSNPIVRMGRSPPPMSRLSGGGIYVVRHSSHSVEDTNLQILYACLVTHDAKA